MPSEAPSGYPRIWESVPQFFERLDADQGAGFVSPEDIEAWIESGRGNKPPWRLPRVGIVEHYFEPLHRTFKKELRMEQPKRLQRVAEALDCLHEAAPLYTPIADLMGKAWARYEQLEYAHQNPNEDSEFLEFLDDAVQASRGTRLTQDLPGDWVEKILSLEESHPLLAERVQRLAESNVERHLAKRTKQNKQLRQIFLAMGGAGIIGWMAVQCAGM